MSGSRRNYNDLCRNIAEFPLATKVAVESSRLSDMIMLDWPNVVRDGS
jgi:alpha-D-ribose 1-methylphosphonate 5-triphosphate diphosphatase PhnM